MFHIIVDIETAPRPGAERFIPDHPPFDPSAVKHGRTIDPALRAAKVESDREAHERAGREAHENFIAKAALSPLTGRIVAIGASALEISGPPRDAHRRGAYLGHVGTDPWVDEAELLSGFYQWVLPYAASGRSLFVSWSGSNQYGIFDADFFWRRGVALGVRAGAAAGMGHLDAAAYFLRYAKPMTFLSLRNACLEVGTEPSYSGPCTGAAFAGMLAEGGDAAEEAKRYLEADVDDLEALWTRVLSVMPDNFEHYYGRAEQ